MNAAELSSQDCAATCCHTASDGKQTLCSTYMQIPIDCVITGKDAVYQHLHLLEPKTSEQAVIMAKGVCDKRGLADCIFLFALRVMLEFCDSRGGEIAI